MSEPQSKIETTRSPAIPPTAIEFKPSDFDFDHPPADPVQECKRWFEDATRLPIPSPNAMHLATVGTDGRPSIRTVLLRGFDESGAVFFTNRQSRKGLDLKGHPYAALHFHWDHIDRQIRIEGIVTPTSDEQSDAYFAGRPRAHQLGAWASEQSRPLANRAAFDVRFNEADRRFSGSVVSRPPHWGGYRVALGTIEFWQGHAARLHDRVVYQRSGTSWNITRLFP